jgi:hypothetical protein
MVVVIKMAGNLYTDYSHKAFCGGRGEVVPGEVSSKSS